jgi:hypothetical protein
VKQVRAKMKCYAVDRMKDGKPDTTCAEIRMMAVYDDGDPTNKSWSQATPSASVTMFVTNPAAIEAFEPGKNYFVDFTPAD